MGSASTPQIRNVDAQYRFAFESSHRESLPSIIRVGFITVSFRGNLYQQKEQKKEFALAVRVVFSKELQHQQEYRYLGALLLLVTMSLHSFIRQEHASHRNPS